MDACRAFASTTLPPAPLAKPFQPLREQIVARLGTICDPHTNVSMVQLGMVDEVHIQGQHVLIVCRCPHTWYTTDTTLALVAEIHQQLADIPGIWITDVVMLSEGTPWHRREPWPQPLAHWDSEAELTLA